MFCVSEVLRVLRQAQSVGADESIINDKASFYDPWVRIDADIMWINICNYQDDKS